MNYFKSIGQLSSSLRQILSAVGILTIFGILDYLAKWNILSAIFGYFANPFVSVVSRLYSDFINTTGLFILVIVSLVLIGWTLWQFSRRLNIVAGEFVDNFKEGLSKWEFGREGWKIEHEDSKPLLSVSESNDGGISKRGFNWADYEFSFDTKIIKGTSSWIIRAENRNKYFMLQLNLEYPKKPRLRPHFKINDNEYPWIALEEFAVDIDDLNLKKPIKLSEWMKVNIIVRGTEIDTYINNEHVFHYFLPDPCRFEKQGKIQTPQGETTLTKDLVVVSYPGGRVGFRCAPPLEHAHFRNVKVRPLV